VNPRTFTIAAAIALLVLAGFLLNTQVNATTPAGGTVACGTVWAPDNSDGQKQADRATLGNSLNQLAGTGRYQPNSYVGFEAACSDALGARGTWGWVAGGIGVLALAGAVLIRRTPRNVTDSRRKASDELNRE
jgi:hypothetical protein